MGSRSAFIVLTTSGNWAHRDPIEEKGRREERTADGTRVRTLGLITPYTKRHRIAELA